MSADRPGPFEYVDHLSLRLSFGPSPDQPPSQVYSLVDGSAHEGDWSDEAILSAFDPVLRPDWHSEVPLPYALDIHKSQINWGAAGAGIEIALYVIGNAGSGVIGGAAYAGVEAALRRFRGEASARERLDRDTAEAATRGEIAAVYLTSDGLSLLGDGWSAAENEWQFRFRAEDGTEYEATAAPGLVVHIARTRVPSAEEE